MKQPAVAAPGPEPRFARVASLIADPTRARMLALLLSGECRSAGELARFAGITAQAGTTQLAQLVDAGLLAVRSQGRHKYFTLADAEIAQALEALSLVAERDHVSERWDRPGFRSLRCARRCYGHLAGSLGVAQLEMLLDERHLEPLHGGPGDGSRSGWRLTDRGRNWMETLGLAAPKDGARAAYPCLDWSERRDHLAGDVARTLLDAYLRRGWLRASDGTRALDVTASGRRELLPLLRA